jgi:hypothetical protein
MAEDTSSSLVGSTPKRVCFAGKMQRADNGFQRKFDLCTATVQQPK